MKPLVLASFLAVCSAVSAPAAIICVAPTSITAGSVTITSPITFPINSVGKVAEFVLDEWVISDGTATSSQFSASLAFSVNGAATSSPTFLYDNWTINEGAITPNDGVFYLNSNYPGVSPGDTVTLAAGTYTLPAKSSFNPQATQTFTGDIFVAGLGFERLSPDVSAVPEPSTWALLSLGAVGAGMVALRWRQRAA